MLLLFHKALQNLIKLVLHRVNVFGYVHLRKSLCLIILLILLLGFKVDNCLLWLSVLNLLEDRLEEHERYDKRLAKLASNGQLVVGINLILTLLFEELFL